MKIENSASQDLGTTIYSVGYGNRGFEGFIDLLTSFSITHVVDVRSVPQSAYWEDFRRERLHLLFRDLEMKYIFMGDTLGGVADSPILCREPQSVDIENVVSKPLLDLGLRKLIEAAKAPGRRICLMCGCMRPHGCHRFHLLGPEIVNRGIEYLHILDYDKAKTQDEIAADVAPQTTLF